MWLFSSSRSRSALVFQLRLAERAPGPATVMLWFAVPLRATLP